MSRSPRSCKLIVLYNKIKAKSAFSHCYYRDTLFNRPLLLGNQKSARLFRLFQKLQCLIKIELGKVVQISDYLKKEASGKNLPNNLGTSKRIYAFHYFSEHAGPQLQP